MDCSVAHKSQGEEFIESRDREGEVDVCVTESHKSGDSDTGQDNIIQEE